MECSLRTELVSSDESALLAEIASAQAKGVDFSKMAGTSGHFSVHRRQYDKYERMMGDVARCQGSRERLPIFDYEGFLKSVSGSNRPSPDIFATGGKVEPDRLPITYLQPYVDKVRSYRVKTSSRSTPVPSVPKASRPVAKALVNCAPTGGKIVASENLVLRKDSEVSRKTAVVDRIVELFSHFEEDSFVWDTLALSFPDRVSRIAAFRSTVWPQAAATAERHVAVISRFVSDAKALGQSGYDWSAPNILNIFIYRVENESAKASTLTSILSALKFFTKIFGLEKSSADPSNFVLQKYASNFLTENQAPLRQAAAIHPIYLARLEKIVTSSREFFKTDVEVFPVTRLWAWFIRLFAGAGIRWSDAQFTSPKSAKLFAEGLTAVGEKTKTRSKHVGNPWSCSSLALGSPCWLETGYGLFCDLPEHDSRDFWVCMDRQDGKNFYPVACDFKRASYHVRRLLLLVGVPLEHIADFRPHSFKPSLMTAAVHQSFSKDGSVSNAEIMLLGSWSEKTAQQMSLRYLRDAQRARLQAGEKAWAGFLDEDLEEINRRHFENNRKFGLTSMFKETAKVSDVEIEFPLLEDTAHESGGVSSIVCAEDSPVLERNLSFSGDCPVFDRPTFERDLLKNYAGVVFDSENPAKKRKLTDDLSPFVVREQPVRQKNSFSFEGLRLSSIAGLSFFKTHSKKRILHVAPRNHVPSCQKKPGEAISSFAGLSDDFRICRRCYDGLSKELKSSELSSDTGCRIMAVEKAANCAVEVSKSKCIRLYELKMKSTIGDDFPRFFVKKLGYSSGFCPIPRRCGFHVLYRCDVR